MQAELRSELRQQVKLYVQGKRIFAPAGLDKLQDYAGEIIAATRCDSRFFNFIVVLLGNEIWKEIVRATPYNRRLLLLPQCLRNESRCRGIFDELGLLCSGCGGCNIDSILNKAEQLGYTTLVAEGTTVALELVEEGAVDAVIGVSCMAVLRRSFEHVTNVAVPVTGIPLLCDGCSATTVDFAWLLDELEDFSGINGFTPLSLSLVKNQVADFFSSAVLQHYFNLQNETERLAHHMMQMGGQRMRPLLAVLAYRAYSEEILDENQQLLAIIIECFHKASLIHDDIEDDEDERYGQPVLHRSEGIPLAVNTGDYLIGKGYALLSQLKLKPEVIAACLSVVATSHLKLAEGQGEDILLHSTLKEKSIEDMIHIFRLKAGEAVKVALLAGAIAGGANEQELKILQGFSEDFGIAYQIRDDLNEFGEEKRQTGFLNFPFLVVLLHQEMKASGDDFSKITEHNQLEIFIEMASRYQVEEKAASILNEFIAQCYLKLDSLENQPLRLALYNVMGKVFKDRKRGN